jgi:hypothetical protein
LQSTQTFELMSAVLVCARWEWLENACSLIHVSFALQDQSSIPALLSSVH